MRFLRNQGIELFFSDGELHYSGPKGSMTPNLLRDLVQNKAEMRSLLRRHAHRQRPAPPLRAVERQGELELSYAQERLWFEEQLSPGSASYNVPVVVRMKGTLDVGALERSLTTVVRRHEALRTTFRLSRDNPVQVIGRPTTIKLEPNDLRSLDPAQQNPWIEKWIREGRTRPFDLERGPLLRAGLARVGEREHVLQLVLHHIVSDAWSMGVLLREVAALYCEEVEGVPAGLNALPVQYADYAAWQRRWLTGGVLEEHLEYWHRRLGGMGEIRRLPPDGEGGVRRGGVSPLGWSAGLGDALRRLGRQEGATLFMTMAAGLATLLSQELGTTDVVIGADVANRHQVDVEGLIGFFVNIVVLRMDLRGDPEFRELLRQVRERVLEMSLHQEVPFERVVEELQPERKVGRTPLFQVLLVMQNAPLPAMKLSGIELEAVEVDNETAKFDLALFVRESQGRLAGSWNYRRDLFRPGTVERLSRRLESVLAAGAARPEMTLSRLLISNRSMSGGLGGAIAAPGVSANQLFPRR